MKTLFELTIIPNEKKFNKIFERHYEKYNLQENDKEEFVNCDLARRGITIIYRPSTYKKKVRLIIDNIIYCRYMNKKEEELIDELDITIGKLFYDMYTLNDFKLTGVTLYKDLDFEKDEFVSYYLNTFRRIGYVKGFSPADYESLEGVDNFCLEGNSNGMAFLVYDLKALLELQEAVELKKKIKKRIVKNVEGVMRIEVKMIKNKAVRTWTGFDTTVEQMRELIKKQSEIYMRCVAAVIPYGDFVKKADAVNIIRNKITKEKLRRKMIQYITLIPDKKSVYLAQKAMLCRNMDEITEAFASINLSPVTLSKRCEVKYLKNLYSYL